MRYTSDLTDSQWEIIKPILQEARYRSIEKSENICVHVHADNIHDTKGKVYTFEKAFYIAIPQLLVFERIKGTEFEKNKKSRKPCKIKAFGVVSGVSERT